MSKAAAVGTAAAIAAAAAVGVYLSRKTLTLISSYAKAAEFPPVPAFEDRSLANHEKLIMTGTLLICTQNLAVSGANQVFHTPVYLAFPRILRLQLSVCLACFSVCLACFLDFHVRLSVVIWKCVAITRRHVVLSSTHRRESMPFDSAAPQVVLNLVDGGIWTGSIVVLSPTVGYVALPSDTLFKLNPTFADITAFVIQTLIWSVTYVADSIVVSLDRKTLRLFVCMGRPLGLLRAILGVEYFHCGRALLADLSRRSSLISAPPFALAKCAGPLK
eukprot:6214774-Pleurochrysis_carterae.AAC.2